MGKKEVKKSSPLNKKNDKEDKNLEKILIQNFVSLQKVMTNLSVKFDELSTQISKLLELFEISAKALAKKDLNLATPIDDKKILGKLDELSGQNKIIARGLTLVHERMSGDGNSEQKSTGIMNPTGNLPPQQPQLKRDTPQHIGNDYQKSPFSRGFE